MLEKVTPKKVAQLFQDEGFKGKIDKLEKSCCVRTAADGRNISVFFYPEDLSEDAVCSSLQIGARFTFKEKEKGAVVKLCNSFNESWRYTKAYVSGEVVVCDQDVWCEDGLSNESFSAIFNTYKNLLGHFLAHIEPAVE